MTKEEAHYGEVHFCSFCKYLQFRYGDYYCVKLEAPVAESGYCDLFIKDGKPTPEKPLVVAKPKQTCADCIYNMGGMCGKTGELAKKACSMFSDTDTPTVSLAEITIIDPDTYEVIDQEELIPDCSTCGYSYYDENGVAMCSHFNAQLDTADLTACIEYNEDHGGQ
jgi:hypothetical protein